ncbi:MAG: transcriptional repressor [Clostridia bacterium]|nr:transcriptional repressor [Clostridia bacterium]MBQ7224682.1 transcriptional repressor [Clostridia bacterium]
MDDIREQVNNERHSKSRDVIYETLAGTKTHPDAEWVYETAKRTCPSLGIATVYRNLKRLSEKGQIVAIETSNGSVHYDACVKEHAHFICEKCGKILDIDFPEVPFTEAENAGYEVHRGKVVLYGLCPHCKQPK